MYRKRKYHKRMRKSCLFLLLYLVSLHLFPQSLDEAIHKQSLHAIEELRSFVAIPNDAINHTDILANITWLETQFKKRGFSTEVLETSNEPLFFAELPKLANAPTLLFYMHLDGQPVAPEKWNQPNPYALELKAPGEDGTWETISWDKLSQFDPDWRLFGRSVADDKGPIVMFLNAMDILTTSQTGIRWNIKVILDSEEEKGSPPMAEAVKKYRNKLSADYLMIHDGPMHLSEKPTLIFGCRGITRVDLCIFGPQKPQHSGHYGNYAPNPVFRMSKLLASMKDESGKVLVKDYYDGIILSPETKALLASVPDDAPAIHQKLGIAEPEKVGDNYQESLQYPSLNVRGIAAAWIGDQARTIVPDQVTAAIDIRLVPESNPKLLQEALKTHIREQGYYLTTDVPTQEERSIYPKICQFTGGDATLPFRTDMDHPFGLWLSQALQEIHGEAPVKIRIMGGTVPIASFINELNIPAIIVPLVNADNNQHSPNENLKLSQIPYGIRTFVGLLERKFTN